MKDYKTGWGLPELMQDDDYKLAHWFSTRLDARYLLKYVIYEKLAV